MFIRKVFAKAPVAIWTIAVLFLGLIASINIDSFAANVSMRLCGATTLRIFAGIVFHSLAFGSIMHWLVLSTSLLLSGLVAETALGRAQTVSILAIAQLTCSPIFLALGDGCTPFLGPACAAWALGGCAVVTTAMSWKTSSILVKVYVASVFVSALALAFEVPEIRYPEAAAFVLGVVAALVVVNRRHKSTISQRANGT